MPILFLNLILLCVCDVRPEAWRELLKRPAQSRKK